MVKLWEGLPREVLDLVWALWFSGYSAGCTVGPGDRKGLTVTRALRGGQGGKAVTHVDLALLRFEVPLDAGVRVGVERDPDEPVPHGLHALDPLRVAPRARRPAEPRGLSGKGSEGPRPRNRRRPRAPRTWQ